MFSAQGDSDDAYIEYSSSESSEEEEGAPVKSRNVLAVRQAVRSQAAAAPAASQFEQDMEQELDATMQAFIQNALGPATAPASSSARPKRAGAPRTKRAKKTSRPGSATGTSDDGASASDFYDDIYFDSGSDGDGEQRHAVADGASASASTQPSGAVSRRCHERRRRIPVLSNDDLFYDPDIDADNELWMANKLRRHRGVRTVRRKKPVVGAVASAAVDTPQVAGPEMDVDEGEQRGDQQALPVPRSDAHLSCPACLSTLCVDCQQHDIYRGQYRAMFVLNCCVKMDQVLKYKPKEAQRKRPKKQRGTSPVDDEAPAAPVLEVGTTGEDYRPVTCAQCSTEVAVYDKDEVYHFFNVLAGHA